MDDDFAADTVHYHPTEQSNRSRLLRLQGQAQPKLFVCWNRLLSMVAASVVLLSLMGQAFADAPSAPVPPQTPAVAHYEFTNRLIREKSPYLLQHAHNPVDWYSWGEEAFARARQENKPIFLSVGYSTCHWCHVMEHESFENPEIAKVLNRGFVCIKLDREERPDVDALYMSFVQATTGSGGWPMTVWLTPELKPFLGGTYFPPEQLKQLIKRVTEAWQKDHERILTSSDSILRKLQKRAEAPEREGKPPGLSLLNDCYTELSSSYDAQHGGFGGAPKFPRPVSLNFLLRYYHQTGNKNAREIVLQTLQEMAKGGIHDHLGGGFHRYSTDARWHVPHFEKMLYDQAQLVCSYLEAYQITQDPFFSEVARDILRYVLQDMTGPQGQFYSAEDADSPVPGKLEASAEGAFYVWDKAEIDAALGSKDAAVFEFVYGVEAKGNVERDSRGELSGKNVLHLTHTLEEAGKKFGISADEAGRRIAEARARLRQRRAARPRPRLDDKTLTAWNGLMISAFARAGQILGDASFIDSAKKARSFLKANLYDPATGVLFRRFRAGERAIEGYADDYAFLIQGLLDLYEANFQIEDFQWAVALQARENELFEDKKHGGYFSTAESGSALLLRLKEDYDGAEPAANSVTVLNLLRLSQMTERQDWRRSAEATLTYFEEPLSKEPATMPALLSALAFSLSKPKQIVIAGGAGAPDTLTMLRVVHGTYLPNKILLLADGADGQQVLGKNLEFLKEMKPIAGRATAFVCENYTCQLPTADPVKLRQQLLQGRSPATR